MDFKKYVDIERIKGKYADVFTKGEHITITEKIDGSNASIWIENGEVKAGSRKQVLKADNTLNGFYDFVMTLPADILKDVLEEKYIIFGEWLCLSGDTVIRKAVAGKGQRDMTLKEMYEFQNTPCRAEYCKRGINKLLNLLYTKGSQKKKVLIEQYHLDRETTINASIQKGYVQEDIEKVLSLTDLGKEKILTYFQSISQWGKEGYPSIYCLNLDNDEIETNKIQKIIYSGKKETYLVKTHKGYEIKSTKEHKFYTPYGFKSLSELKEKDCVGIVSYESKTHRSRTYGKGTRQIVNFINEYKNKIGKCEKCGDIKGLHVHHRDGNHFNNNIENYQVLCSECHKLIHKEMGNFNNKPVYDYEFDYIESITPCGEEDCYDICMEGLENVANFIANNFIVHNCKHTVRYPEDKMKTFYVFDVWNRETEQYMPWTFTKQVAEFLGLKLVPLFYDGEFTSWEEHMKLVGKTEMGGEPCGEGIVIKSQDRLDNKSSRTPAYLKIVSEKFSEVHDAHPKKLVDPETLAKREADKALAATIVTERRVEKCIQKFIDNGEFPAEWDEKNLGQLAKILPKAVFADCVKEEPETVEQIEGFGKICGSLTMQFAKKMIK